MANSRAIPLFLWAILSILKLSHGFTAVPPFSAEKIADLSTPRGLVVDPAGDILVVEVNGGDNPKITAIFESDSNSGKAVYSKVTIVDGTGLGLNHGIVYANGSLYASSETTVYQWNYAPGQRTLITDPPRTVIRNIPAGGVHTTRSLIIDPSGSVFFVAIGSNSNVDEGEGRAKIRSFDDSLGLPEGGFLFENGKVFADGLRNNVGFDFDASGIIFGVDNGADGATRPEFGDIHAGNPADELNRFDSPAQHYGYPYCFSAGELEGFEAGSQLAWSDFMNDGIHSDDWCQNPVNNKPVALPLPAHHAPLGLKFYKGDGCDATDGSFPCAATGDAIIAFHGSTVDGEPVGQKVVSFTFDTQTGLPTGESVDILTGTTAVNVAFTKNGHLVVSDDESNQLIFVTYESAKSRRVQN